MRCILAVDGGGTKSESMVCREDGTILGWGYTDRKSIKLEKYFVGVGRSRECIAHSVSQALDGVEYDELVAYNSTGSPIEVRGESVPFTFLREDDSALALVGCENGVVIVAGTGAVVCGRTRDGRALALDGLGPNLGDYGSGYYIGQMGMRAAAKCGWHPRHETTLGAAIRRMVGCPETDHVGESLVRFSLSDFDRGDIAAFAKVVSTEAAAGDRVALKIMEDAASALAETVYDVVERLDMRTEYPLVGTGSLMSGSRLYWQLLCSRVHEFAPHLRPVISNLPPVVGLGVIALKRAHGDDWREPVDRLLKCAAEHVG